MQSETGFPSSHQLKSYVASKSRLKLAARAVLSADAGLLVNTSARSRPSQFYSSDAHILKFHAFLAIVSQTKRKPQELLLKLRDFSYRFYRTFSSPA